MKEVYVDSEGNLSFEWVPNENVCVGSTDGTLDNFRAWLDEQEERGEVE